MVTGSARAMLRPRLRAATAASIKVFIGLLHLWSGEMSGYELALI